MDPAAVIEAALWTLIFARSTLEAGCKPGNRIRRTLPSAVAREAAHRLPADYLEIGIDPKDDLQRQTSTPTFGIAQGVAGADAIIPTRHTFDIRFSWDPDTWAKKFPAAMEPDAEGVAALNAAYPKLGVAWVRSFEISGTLSTPPGTRAGRLVSTKRVTVEGRPHLSDLR